MHVFKGMVTSASIRQVRPHWLFLNQQQNWFRLHGVSIYWAFAEGSWIQWPSPQATYFVCKNIWALRTTTLSQPQDDRWPSWNYITQENDWIWFFIHWTKNQDSGSKNLWVQESALTPACSIPLKSKSLPVCASGAPFTLSLGLASPVFMRYQSCRLTANRGEHGCTNLLLLWWPVNLSQTLLKLTSAWVYVLESWGELC